ncbi:MAG: single-stranded DNA-binding protein [Crocinitomicaceae bacterium]|jgi:single-strand DNA-binding protein|nr:single-stranded DNA-binding protein [Crocinitomicaceae bacterium]MCF8443645.1 single-stranded DNA-binding protein [Crocinitomicaceae bacterium]
MNYVNLIGKARSAARFIELDNGKKVVKFTMSTKETYFDEKGKSKSRDTWHTLTAWGNWIKVLEELELKGTNLAIEGKIVSRFYKAGGIPKLISEIEINDLTLIPNKH